NRSYIWESCVVYTLKTSMRIQDTCTDGTTISKNKAFNEWLLKMGNGTLPAQNRQDENDPTWIEIPEKHCVMLKTDHTSDIISHTYPDFRLKWNTESYLKERAILTPLNDTAEELNHQIFKQVPGEEKSYKSCDEICKASQDTNDVEIGYPTEFLNTLTFPGMPPHVLTLKEGIPVLMLRNINPGLGLCNGTRLLHQELPNPKDFTL
ncbi:unnamed protein product, partial [Cuscuta campestris]